MKIEDINTIIGKFREVDADIPIGQIQVLLTVAMAGDYGVTMTDISTKLNIGMATLSRYVAGLGKINRHHEEGMCLVDAVEDPMERRRKILTLSLKGKVFIQNLIKE